MLVLGLRWVSGGDEGCMVALGLGVFWVERKILGGKEREGERDGWEGGFGVGSRNWGSVRLIR
ncbi:unnamed protein product [Prunus brigantina]